MIIFVGPRGCGSLYLLLMIIVGLILVILRVSRDVCDPANWRWAAARLAVHAPAPPTVNTESKESGRPASEDDNTRAFVLVQVPTEAQVWLDGRQGKQTGPSRTFRTPPLEPGVEYEYDVRARWPAEDRLVDRTRRVKVRAGARAEVDFTKPEAAEH